MNDLATHMNNQEKSEEILAYALQNVPFYRDHWRSYDINGHSVDERYRALPVLTKADMARRQDANRCSRGLRPSHIPY